MQGYKVTVFNTARNKTYSFNFLNNKTYIENELKDLGFSEQDIAEALVEELSPSEVQELTAEMDAVWDNC
ncbi:hypothetical protein CAL7716_085080 [Calothrix sp. PCC 7716]|nr:hypothetical protein CAL7716_085080 [Calothrix sp. PCC 7716]